MFAKVDKSLGLFVTGGGQRGIWKINSCYVLDAILKILVSQIVSKKNIFYTFSALLIQPLSYLAKVGLAEIIAR